mmetsp:Transcript_63072/g.167681  ORF Transcript_63072/g.167681 Transcript_63072/m.167681 type:complete len:356 (+) Transcript_63072:1936-3003(+)
MERLGLPDRALVDIYHVPGILVQEVAMIRQARHPVHAVVEQARRGRAVVEGAGLLRHLHASNDPVEVQIGVDAIPQEVVPDGRRGRVGALWAHDSAREVGQHAMDELAVRLRVVQHLGGVPVPLQSGLVADAHRHHVRPRLAHRAPVVWVEQRHQAEIQPGPEVGVAIDVVDVLVAHPAVLEGKSAGESEVGVLLDVKACGQIQGVLVEDTCVVEHRQAEAEEDQNGPRQLHAGLLLADFLLQVAHDQVFGHAVPVDPLLERAARPPRLGLPRRCPGRRRLREAQSLASFAGSVGTLRRVMGNLPCPTRPLRDDPGNLLGQLVDLPDQGRDGRVISMISSRRPFAINPLQGIFPW